MKTASKIACLLVLSFVAKTQQNHPDSLRTILQNATTDSVKHNIWTELTLYYSEVNRDSALFYAEKRLDIAKQNNIKLAEAFALAHKGYQYSQMGKYAESYQNFMLALRIAEDPTNKEIKGWRITEFPIPVKNKDILLAYINLSLGFLMRNIENQSQEIVLLKKGLSIARQINNVDRQMAGNMVLASAYISMNKLDSALYFAKEADLISKNPAFRGLYRGLNLSYLGDIYLKKGDKQMAKKYYYEGLSVSKEKNIQSVIAVNNRKLIQIFLQENEKDSALVYAVRNLEIVKSLQSETVLLNMGTANEDVYLAYKLNNQVDSAYQYQGLALIAKERFYKNRIKSIADFQNLSLEESQRLEKLEKEKIQTLSKIRNFGMLAGLAFLSIIGLILYRNNRQKQKANVVLQVQKEEIQSTLSKLKTTQAQLIQSEKLASLGELTAGIAHEIQNPLNFVNNFSEVSIDLAKELEEEAEKPEIDKELIIDLAKDLSKNLIKINHHGQRASDIVKGMLEHSRTSINQKEPTDINALCDEYLRLAYHGLKAKDKSFNATIETHFDPNLPKIKVIPQDIGRVILNLINNAFYAVNERSKNIERAASPSGDGGKGGQGQVHKYDPTISITTQLTANSQLLITIKDNGSGIPDAIKEKIFQPFFTTKPTRQGTGLGLSLAYDMVKAHDGELTLDSTEGVGTEFMIKIPIA